MVEQIAWLFHSSIGMFFRRTLLFGFTTTIFVRRMIVYIPPTIYLTFLGPYVGFGELYIRLIMFPFLILITMVSIGVLAAGILRLICGISALFGAGSLGGILIWPLEALWRIEAGEKPSEEQIQASMIGLDRDEREAEECRFKRELDIGEARLTQQSVAVDGSLYDSLRIEEGKLFGFSKGEKHAIGRVQRFGDEVKIEGEKGQILMAFDSRGLSRDGKVLAHPKDMSEENWLETMTKGSPDVPCTDYSAPNEKRPFVFSPVYQTIAVGVITAASTAVAHFVDIDPQAALSGAGSGLTPMYNEPVANAMERSSRAEPRTRQKKIAYMLGRTDTASELSATTRTVLTSLDEELLIRAYFSKNLPAPFDQHEAPVRELLDRYVSAGLGNVKVEVISPDGDRTLQAQAKNENVVKAPYATIGVDTKKNCYRGVSFGYRGHVKAIPVLSRGASLEGLEYDFTSTIKSLLEERPTICFVVGHGELSAMVSQKSSNGSTSDSGVSYLKKLVREYELRDVHLARDWNRGNGCKGLVVAGPTEQIPLIDQYAIDQFVMKGGPVAFFLDGMNVEITEKRVNVSTLKTGLDGLLGTYGAKLESDIVMDTQCDRYLVIGQVRTPMGNLPMSIPRPYPAWPHLSVSEIAQNDALVFRLPGLTMLWPSTVFITKQAADNNQIETRVLARTTEKAWSVTENFNLDPRQDETEWMAQRKSARRKGRLPLVVELAGMFPSHFAHGRPAGGDEDVESGTPEHHFASQRRSRILVVGDADFLKHQFVGSNRRPRHTPSNMSFMINALDWLAHDEEFFATRTRVFFEHRSERSEDDSSAATP